MQNYVLDFKQDTGCIDIKTCWPNYDEFYIPFAEYLMEKKGFQELWPYVREKNIGLVFSAFRGSEGVAYKHYRRNGSNTTLIPLLAPSKAYVAAIDEDFYSYGKSASMIYLLIDNKRFGNKDGTFYSSPKNYPGEFPRAGKDLFIFHVNYDGKFVPEGAEPYKYWKDNDTCNPDNSETRNVSGFGCLGRIIEDGWQIKYKW